MSEEKRRCVVGDELLVDIMFTSFARNLRDLRMEDYVVVEKSEERGRELRTKYGVRTAGDIMVVAPRTSALIMLYHDPAEMREAMQQISGRLPSEALIASAAPHVKIEEIEQVFPNHAVVRLIINPSSISGAGVGAYYAGSVASRDAAAVAKMIISSLGREIPVSTEDELDLVYDILSVETMYSYAVIRGLVECAVKAGLSEKQGKLIVGQIFAGSLKTILGADEEINTFFEQAGKKNQHLANKAIKLGRLYGFEETIAKALTLK